MTQQRARRSVDERRDQLIDAALVVLADEGLTAATTRRITDEAGLALGAFHYAFRSKHELLRAIIERTAAEVAEVFQSEVAGARDLRHAVEAMIRGYWRYVEEHPRVQLAQYELIVHALRDPDLRPLAAWHYQRYVDAVDAALADVPGAPGSAGRDELARFLIASLDGLVLHHCIQGDLTAARARLERCVGAATAVDWAEAAAMPTV